MKALKSGKGRACGLVGINKLLQIYIECLIVGCTESFTHRCVVQMHKHSDHYGSPRIRV